MSFQPTIDTASVIEGTGTTQLGMPVNVSNLNPRFAGPTFPLRDSYLVSEPWIETSSIYAPNKDAPEIPSSQNDATPAPVVRILSVDVSKQTIGVRALQRWTGRVERVVGDRFVAVISDVTNPTNPAEEVELDIEEVSAADRPLIAEGAIFYWAIVYRDTKSGQRERIATIRLARQPKLRPEDVQEIFDEADEMVTFLESA